MSADTKRTEGPWRWVEDPDLGRLLVGPSYELTARLADRYRAALLCATGGIKSDYTIDAHDDVEALAAAAPDLYAALDSILACRPTVLGSMDEVRAFAAAGTAARAALSKARGEAP